MTRRRAWRGRRTLRLLRPAWLVAAVLVIAVTVPVLATVATAWARGWTLHGVLTGSMEPNVPTGSAVMVAPVRPDDLTAGQIIIFHDPTSPDRVVAHRVHRVVEQPSGLFVQTRGDANNTVDSALVPIRMVRGEVVGHVAGLGSAVAWLGKPRHVWLLVGLPVALLALSEILGWVTRLRARRHDALVAHLRRRIHELEEELRSLPRPALAPTSPSAPGSPRRGRGRRWAHPSRGPAPW